MITFDMIFACYTAKYLLSHVQCVVYIDMDLQFFVGTSRYIIPKAYTSLKWFIGISFNDKKIISSTENNDSFGKYLCFRVGGQNKQRDYSGRYSSFTLLLIFTVKNSFSSVPTVNRGTFGDQWDTKWGLVCVKVGPHRTRFILTLIGR